MPRVDALSSIYLEHQLDTNPFCIFVENALHKLKLAQYESDKK